MASRSLFHYIIVVTMIFPHHSQIKAWLVHATLLNAPSIYAYRLLWTHYFCDILSQLF